MQAFIPLYYDKYKDDERFEFIRLKDKGHNYIFNDRTYIDEFNAEFGEWLKALDYDYNAKENNDRFKTDKANYIHQHLDRMKCYTERAVDKHPKIWQNKNNKTGKGKRL